MPREPAKKKLEAADERCGQNTFAVGIVGASPARCRLRLPLTTRFDDDLGEESDVSSRRSKKPAMMKRHQWLSAGDVEDVTSLVAARRRRRTRLQSHRTAEKKVEIRAGEPASRRPGEGRIQRTIKPEVTVAEDRNSSAACSASTSKD